MKYIFLLLVRTKIWILPESFSTCIYSSKHFPKESMYGYSSNCVISTMQYLKTM